MKISICSAIFILAVFNLRETTAATDKVICYYGSWSTYRAGKGKFDVENIDPKLCTHVVYSFVGLLPDATIRVLDEYNDLEENWGKGGFKRFNKLKQLNPNLKTMIAIGGYNEGSITYSNVMASDSLRAKFVQNALTIVTKFDFDGFDLDWEYPAQRGGGSYDVNNFSKLIRELRAVFEPRGLILSAAVAAAEFSVSISYNVPELSKYLDFINVMTYDLHGPWDRYTGQHAGLYASSKDVTALEKQLNVEACIDSWIRKGADPSKIILGLATYGKSYTLDNPVSHGLGAPATNPGNAGPYTLEQGMLGYNEIVELQRAGGWTVVWDDEQKVPYMYKGNQWVGYDDPESIKLKVEYAESKGLGGVMIWSIETDDFQGLSGTKFVLLEAINSALGSNNNPGLSPTTQKPSKPIEPTQTPSSTEKPSGGGDPSSLCTKQGYIRDPIDCSTFYYCLLTAGGYKAAEFKCSSGLVFDLVLNTCNYTWNTKC